MHYLELSFAATNLHTSRAKNSSFFDFNKIEFYYSDRTFVIAVCCHLAYIEY